MASNTRPGELPSALMRLDIDLSEHPQTTLPGSALRNDLSGALDGVASAIPIALCGVALVYVNFPASLLSNGVFASLLAIAAMQLTSAAGGRPMIFSARLFEAITLSAMLGQFVKYMPAWGLQATPQVLIALMCVLGAMAATACALLFLLRADRFARLIPAPVYAGFAISISLLLLISQGRELWRLWGTGHSAVMLVSVCAVAIAVNVATRRFRPGWPASAIGLLAAAAVAVAWLMGGATVTMVMAPGQPLGLPWSKADFAVLMAPGTQTLTLLQSLLYNAAVLGLILFINMTLANEIVSQSDDRYANRWQHAAVSMTGALGAGIGAVPLAASQQAAASAMRTGPLSRRKVLAVGMAVAILAFSGMLQWIALAAVAGVMLCDSFYMADRPALKAAWHWARGAQLHRSKLEDLMLVLAVTVSAVAFNAVVAVVLGLFLGLLMFAARNAKKPVRRLWTGQQVHSNCARGAHELALMGRHGQAIKVLELESELFFGAVSSLDHSLMASLEASHTVIADWTRVRHVDSSIALAVARWARAAKAAGVQILHAGAGQEQGNALEFLNQYFSQAVLLPDLDRALEAAENALLEDRAGARTHQPTALYEQIPLFQGLVTSQLVQMQSSMRERHYLPGEVILKEGDPSNAMLVLLQGRASVMMRIGQRDVRLSGMRRGSVVGELGFLDGAPRSATVVAQEAVLAYELTREAFEALRRQSPETAFRIANNLTLDLAARLRHTSRLALARSQME
jgi:sulfate permease, SulP family